MARNLKRETRTVEVGAGELSYDREWTEGEDGRLLVEQFTHGRLNGQPISDEELRLLLPRR